MRKSMKDKIAERFRQRQADRIYENKVLKFDERRSFINDADREIVSEDVDRSEA